MRPKDLKFPYSFEKRIPAFHEGVLIVPICFERHTEYDFSHLFSTEGRPLSIEYCSGHGHWIIEKAKGEPNRLFIAVEKQFERVRKIWSKMKNGQINNLLIVWGEALTFTKHYLSADSVDEVFVNFPDPWPKSRHAKHRLIRSSFVEEISRVIKRNGRACYATDHPQYAGQMIDEMEKHGSWQSVFPSPHYISEWKEYGWSWFQDLFEKKGESLYFIQYRCR